jgi:hypothetical protein
VITIAFVAALSGLVSPAQSQSQKTEAKEPLKLTPAEEQESYAIYGTILRTARYPRKVTTWQIRRETVSLEYCRKISGESAPIYQPVIDDYGARNRSKVVLERKFDLPSYEIFTIGGNTRSGDDMPIAGFSAVGFNQDLTRAAVCATIEYSGTCYMLVKKNGVWEHDKDYRGNGCAWAGDPKYDPK